MSNFQLPPFIVPANTPPETVEWVRDQLLYMAQQFQTGMDELRRDKRFSDERTANALRSMQGSLSLDKLTARVTLPAVLYSPDGINVMLGSPNDPSPTDPGPGPPGGLTDGDYGDIVVHSGGTGMTIDAGVVDYAKMASVTGPILVGRHSGVLGSLGNITIPTRKEFYPHTDLTEITATGVVASIVGTAPDAYTALALDPTNRIDLELVVPVSNLWRTGNYSVSLLWAAGTQEASTWVPVAEELGGAAGTLNLVAAGNDLAPAPVSANVTADILRRTTVGSFAVGAAAEGIRLVVGRDPGNGSDNYTGSVYLLGVELTFTPIY